jgi:exonuclease III
MSAKISFSTWNIHGLSHNVLGDKTKNKDFLNCIKNIDFLFLTETWSDKNIDIPGFKAFVSDVATSHTTRASRKSGGIALLTKIKFEKNVLPVKQSKNFLWCKVSKELLNIEKDLYLCGVYIPPEKSAYFEKEIFDILENDIALFSSKGYTMILGNFNARTNKLEDYITKNGNNFIQDTSENSLQTKIRQNFDNQINNHGKQLINLCKSSDLRTLNGRTKGDSLGRATFHGSNGISVVDYIICDQELFQKVEHFIVKHPTYLSDHSQIITWIDIKKYIAEPNVEPCNIQMTKLPKQFIWDKQSKNNFRQTLK